MRHDELAFLNLQLAGMLKSGIPLEGAIQQLSRSMRRGTLREEFEALNTDLAKGVPLKEAIATRHLPDLYRRMLIVGSQTNDLPGVLTLLADHYNRINSISTRLKGLMVYPSIVVVASLGLSFFLALFLRAVSEDLPKLLTDVGPQLAVGRGLNVMIWMPVAALGVVTLLLLLVMIFPALRRWLRWHLPGFKEAALAQLASAMRLMLKAGTNLADALGLLGYMESNTPAGRDVARWQSRLADGHRHFSDIASDSKVIPPLFSWIVSSAQEDLAKGFERAAEIYQARASYRTEMLLYGALPISILFLGVMLASQAYPVIRLFVQFGSLLDQMGL